MKSFQIDRPSVLTVRNLVAAFLVMACTATAEDLQWSPLGAGSAMAMESAYGGMIQTFCLDGDYAYVSEGMNLVIFDLSTPTNPVETGRCVLPDMAWQIEVADGYAYVADWGKGLQIVDVSDPTAPFVTGGWIPDNSWRNGYAVSVYNGYAYLGGNETITVLDVSDPAAPQVDKFVFGDFRAQEMLVDGNYLYMAGWDSGLVVYSLADAATPSYVTNVNPAGYGYFHGLALSGDTLYLAGGEDGMFAMDVSNPASPLLLGKYPSAYKHSGSFNKVALHGQFAYLTDEDGLWAIDVSNPESPAYHSYAAVSNGLTAVASGHGFVYAAQSRFSIYSPANGATPPQFQNAYEALADIKVLEFYNDTLLASAWAQADLVRVSVTNPAAPRTMQRYAGFGSCNAILAQNGIAVAVGGPDSNLRTFRIGETSPIELLGSLSTPGGANRLTRSGSVFYVGDESSGVMAVDASDPEHPATLDQYNCNYVRDLAYGAGHVYVADGSDQLLILDASNPANLELAAEYDLATTIVRYDDHTLVTRASSPGNFCILSVTNPAAPVLLSEKYTSAYTINDIQVENNLVYILGTASSGSGLWIYDISTPSSPYLKASYDLPAGAWCVAVDGLYAYVGLGARGMAALKLLIPRISSVEPDFVPAGWTVPVMLYGDGFADGAQVDIGALPVTSTSVVAGTQIEALIPNTVAPGLYDVKITNPGGLNDTVPAGLRVVDTTADGVYARTEDLFTTPAQPRATETCALALHLYRVGGTDPMTNYPVVFYEGNPDFNGTVIGTGTVAVLPAEGMATCSGVNWTPTYATDADIYAVPGASGVKVYRNIEVGASTADASAPTVNSVLINGSSGNQNTSGRNVTLQINASDVGSEVKNMWVEEDVWNTGMGYWQTVQKARWQPFESTLDWTLTGAPGSHYISVWVSDAYGNISELCGQAFINLVPLSISIAEGQSHIYNYNIDAGDPIHIDVVPTRGDPDLYVGTYDTGSLYSSRKDGTATESLDFAAPLTEWYSIIVYGYSSANYSISINGIHASAAAVEVLEDGDTKPVPDFEFAGSGPPLQAGLPAAPVSSDPPVTSIVVQIDNLTVLPDYYMPGDTVRLACHLENQGSQTLSGTFNLTIHDSAGAPIQILSQPFTALGAGDETDIAQYWTNNVLVPRNSEFAAYVVSGSATSAVQTLRSWSDAPFFISHIGTTNQTTEIEWPSVAGRIYAVEMTTNLAAPVSFTVVSNNITATPPVNRLAWPVQAPRCFWRAEESSSPP